MSKIKDYKMQPCNWSSIADLIKHYHYLHRKPACIMQCFILLDTDNLTPLGAAVFTAARFQYAKKFLEFARLWVDDRCPRNTESRFVGYCLRYLATQYPDYEGVVTWADPQQGHDGTLYKACNFVFDGYSRPVSRYYNPKTKRIIYEKTRVRPHWVKVDTQPPKLRYIYYFNPKVRENVQHKFSHYHSHNHPSRTQGKHGYNPQRR